MSRTSLVLPQLLMCEVEELRASDLMAHFKRFKHDPSTLFYQVQLFAQRLELDHEEIRFLINDLKGTYRFQEGSLAYGIGHALSDYIETTDLVSLYRKEKENFFQRDLIVNFY